MTDFHHRKKLKISPRMLFGIFVVVILCIYTLLVFLGPNTNPTQTAQPVAPPAEATAAPASETPVPAPPFVEGGNNNNNNNNNNNAEVPVKGIDKDSGAEKERSQQDISKVQLPTKASEEPLPDTFTCIMWRQTGDCNPDSSKREKDRDMACDRIVAYGRSGYCECRNDLTQKIARFGKATCVHKPFSCDEACTSGKAFEFAPRDPEEAPPVEQQPDPHGERRRAALAAQKCVAFRRTQNCSPKGHFVPDLSMSCEDIIPNGISGFCECTDESVRPEFTCEHEAFTCAALCSAPGEHEREVDDARLAHDRLVKKLRERHQLRDEEKIPPPPPPERHTPPPLPEDEAAAADAAERRILEGKDEDEEKQQRQQLEANEEASGESPAEREANRREQDERDEEEAQKKKLEREEEEKRKKKGPRPHQGNDQQDYFGGDTHDLYVDPENRRVVFDRNEGNKIDELPPDDNKGVAQQPGGSSEDDDRPPLDPNKEIEEVVEHGSQVGRRVRRQKYKHELRHLDHPDVPPNRHVELGNEDRDPFPTKKEKQEAPEVDPEYA